MSTPFVGLLFRSIRRLMLIDTLNFYRQQASILLIVLYVPMVSVHTIVIESEKIHNQLDLMIPAIERILDDFISKQSNSLFIYAATSSSLSKLHGQLKPNELLDKLLPIMTNQPKLGLYINALRHPLRGNDSLWIFDDVKKFSKYFNKITTKHFDADRYFIIAMLAVKEENHYDTVNRILVDCWTHHIANVVILVPTQNYNRISLYTHFPYSDDHCERVKPIVQSFFENNSFDGNLSQLFPNKCGNLHQCPMHVAVADDIPYTFLTGYGTNETPHFSGLDAMVLGEISRRLNFAVVVLPYNAGFLDENDYYKVNISFAGVNPLYKERYRPARTIPYIYDAKLYVIPPGKLYSPFATLFFPFEMDVWIGVCSSFLLIVMWIVVLKFMSKNKRDFVVGRKNDAPMLNLFSVVLGGSMTNHQLPQRNFARTMILILLLASLILRNAYLGNLFDFLRTQKRMEPLYHIQDIYDSDVKIYAWRSRGPGIIPPEVNERVTYLDVELNLDEIRGDNLDGVYCQLKNIVDYNNFKNFRKPKLLMTKDYIKMYPILMMVRQRTCLKTAIDHQIRSLHSSGLVEYWQKAYIKTVEDPVDNEPKKLKINQFSSLIQICTATYALSFLIFLVELVASRCRRIKILMDFLTFK